MVRSLVRRHVTRDAKLLTVVVDGKTIAKPSDRFEEDRVRRIELGRLQRKEWLERVNTRSRNS